MTLVVGLCGASAAGKSWLAQEIISIYAGTGEVINQDGYYRDNDVVQALAYRHDNPAALAFHRLVDDLQQLLTLGHTTLPIYDYTTHSVIGRREIDAPDLLVVEGHLLFAWAALCTLCDYKIWVESPADVRLSRRLRRDVQERGRDADDVRHRFNSEAEPAHQQFVAERRDVADEIFSNDPTANDRGSIAQLLERIERHRKC